MKRLETFLSLNPSYTKWGDARLAQKLNLVTSTVTKFKKTAIFKAIKTKYISSL
jgi:hypothetical protein